MTATDTAQHSDTTDLYFQRSLFDRPAPAQGHSATSRAAAESIEPRAGTLRGFVLAYIRGTGEMGATDEEMQTALDMNPSTQRPRRIELVEKGFVKKSDKTRLTKSKRAAAVWVAVEDVPRS